MSYTAIDDNWSCTWYTTGCTGESFGDGTAWLSRRGTDGTTDTDYLASTAMHEAAHYFLGTSNEAVVESQSSYCASLIGWAY